MQTKSKAALFTLTALLILGTVGSIVFYVSRVQSAVIAGSNDNLEGVPNPDVNAGAQVASSSGSSQTVNDITVEITSARIIDTGVEIGFCYTTLDGGEWYPVPEQLLFSSEEGSYKVFPDEYEFVEEKLADKDNVGLNCGLVRYLIDDLKTITAPLHFSLSQIIVHPREMYSLCEDFQYRLATSSKANQFGLTAECSANSEGVISATLVDYDKSASLDVVSRVLEDIAKYEIHGPWEFTITEIER